MIRSGTNAARRPASVPVRLLARRRDRRLAIQRLPLPLLLRRLPGVRALPRARRHARPCRRNRHLPDGARSRAAQGGHGRPAVPALLQQGFPLVHRLLPDPDWQHRRRAGLSDRCPDSLFHGPRGRRPLAGRGARPAALPASTNAPRSGRSHRTRPRRHRSGSSPSARRSYSAGGCAGSAGRRPSSTSGRRPRGPCRTCSRGAGARLLHTASEPPPGAAQRGARAASSMTAATSFGRDS